MDRALWISWYDLPDNGRDVYLSWLHGVYMPKLVERPGFLWAAHYKTESSVPQAGVPAGAPGRLRHTDDPAVPTGNAYILLFGAEHAHAFAHPTPRKLHAELPMDDQKMLAIRVGERVNIFTDEYGVGGPEASKRDPKAALSPCMQLGSFNAGTASEDELLDWYANWRLPSMNKLPGCVGIRKLVSVSGWAKHGVLYEFASLAARNKHFPDHEKANPEMDAWTDRLVRKLVHAPGSPCVAQRLHSVVKGLLAGLCLLASMAADGLAQGYPAKPVRYLVAFSAGSGADTLGRIVAAGLGAAFGQQVVVENRTGAAGNIAADYAAKSPPDGYLLFQASLTHAVNATLYKSLPYDLVRDFAPVTQLASSPNVVVVHPSLPVRTISDLVKLAKAKPGEINYASAGVGSATFLAAELFKSAAGINMMHVPYRGGGEAIIAVMTGEASLQFGPIASWAPQLNAGRGRAIAITSSRRLPTLPELPTVAESGYPGYASGNWYGLLLPVKTPRDIISAARTATVSALNNPAVNKRLTDLGYLVIGDQSDEFAAHIRSEIETLGTVIRKLGLSAD